jgi:3-hydroxybutyryl-CoA dehydratase
MTSGYFSEDRHIGQTAGLSKTITEEDRLMLGTRVPGAGSIYPRQSLKFCASVKIGHTVDAMVEITDLNLSQKSATLRTRCMVKEDVVIDGEAIFLVPTRD